MVVVVAAAVAVVVVAHAVVRAEGGGGSHLPVVIVLVGVEVPILALHAVQAVPRISLPLVAMLLNFSLVTDNNGLWPVLQKYYGRK